MNNPYEILGMSEESSFNQLERRYEGLREKYSELRYKPGEEGNDAAVKLMELERAWAIIKHQHHQSEAKEQFGSDFGEVESLIKSGDYSAAQTLMDDITVRTAEWHYYQSVIYYKREWLSESRAQLALAVSMDPSNKKYSDALKRLDTVMGSGKTDPNSFGTSDTQFRANNNDMGSSLCRCCQLYCCIECLCSICCR